MDLSYLDTSDFQIYIDWDSFAESLSDIEELPGLLPESLEPSEALESSDTL